MLFLKSEWDIVIAPIRPSVWVSVMLSPPKPLDEIQPNLACELLTGTGHAMAFFLPCPLGRGQISFNFNYKVIFKDFYTILCVCSHKWKIQNISDRILILLPLFIMHATSFYSTRQILGTALPVSNGRQGLPKILAIFLFLCFPQER